MLEEFLRQTDNKTKLAMNGLAAVSITICLLAIDDNFIRAMQPDQASITSQTYDLNGGISQTIRETQTEHPRYILYNTDDATVPYKDLDKAFEGLELLPGIRYEKASRNFRSFPMGNMPAQSPQRPFPDGYEDILSRLAQKEDDIGAAIIVCGEEFEKQSKEVLDSTPAAVIFNPQTRYLIHFWETPSGRLYTIDKDGVRKAFGMIHPM